MAIEISPPNHYSATLIRGLDDQVLTPLELEQCHTFAPRQVAPPNALSKIKPIESEATQCGRRVERSKLPGRKGSKWMDSVPGLEKGPPRWVEEDD